MGEKRITASKTNNVIIDKEKNFTFFGIHYQLNSLSNKSQEICCLLTIYIIYQSFLYQNMMRLLERELWVILVKKFQI